MAVETANSTAAATAETFAPRTGRALSLRANFAWTFGGNVIYAGCQWGMLVVLAKLVSPEAVGSFALALAVTAPVIMLTNLQLRNVQATDAHHQYAFGQYFALRLGMTALGFLVIAGLCAFSGYSQTAALVILAVGVAKCFEAISDVIYGLLQQHERMDRIALSMTVKGILSLTALAAGVYLTGNVLWGAVALAGAWLTVLLFYDLPTAAWLLRHKQRTLSDHSTPRSPASKEGLRPVWTFRPLFALAWLALPLGIVMLLVSLNGNIPRYFVEHYLGTRELGFFAAIAYLLVAGNTVVTALGQSASPRLSRLYALGNRRAFATLIARLTVIAVVLGLAGIMVAWTIGPMILRLFYQAEYADFSEVFVWIMVAACVSYVGSFLGYGMTAARYFKSQTPLFALVAIATGAACFLLVPTYHLAGAAFALLVGNIVQVAGSLAVIIFALTRNRPEKASL